MKTLPVANSDLFSSSSSFISLCFRINFKGYSKVVRRGNLKIPPGWPPLHHNIVRKKDCEGVWLNFFSNYFNKNSNTLFLKKEKLNEFVINARRQFQILGPQ